MNIFYVQSDWSVKESFGITFALIDFVWVENRGAALSFVWVSSQSISPSLWNLVMCFKEKNDFFTIYEAVPICAVFFSNLSNNKLVERHCWHASLHFDFNSCNYVINVSFTASRFDLRNQGCKKWRHIFYFFDKQPCKHMTESQENMYNI